jgi:hypothetical protein
MGIYLPLLEASHILVALDSIINLVSQVSLSIIFKALLVFIFSIWVQCDPH